jgi:hypothetical protein
MKASRTQRGASVAARHHERARSRLQRPMGTLGAILSTPTCLSSAIHILG